jgi:glycosyltransferase involved in cell wall biosynthesis
MISLATIVKNEEKYIKRCIDSVKKLVDEIVVVDTGSTDNTMNILQQFQNVKLFQYEWCNDFSSARNFAIENCNGDYILVLDADEYVTFGKRKELNSIMNEKLVGQIAVKSQFKRDEQVFHSISFVSRFFPRSLRYTGAIHEQLDSTLPKTKMKFTVKHDGYFETDKSIRNIPLLENEINKNPNDPYYLFQLGKEYRLKKLYDSSFDCLIKAYKFCDKNLPYYGEVVLELIYSGKECKNDAVLGIIEENENSLYQVSDFHFAKGLFFLDYCLEHPNKANLYIQEIEKSFLYCLSLENEAHIEYVTGTSSFLAAYNLGVFYEVVGNKKKAEEFYKKSYKSGYGNAKVRLDKLN